MGGWHHSFEKEEERRSESPRELLAGPREVGNPRAAADLAGSRGVGGSTNRQPTAAAPPPVMAGPCTAPPVTGAPMLNRSTNRARTCRGGGVGGWRPGMARPWLVCHQETPSWCRKGVQARGSCAAAGCSRGPHWRAIGVQHPVAPGGSTRWQRQVAASPPPCACPCWSPLPGPAAARVQGSGFEKRVAEQGSGEDTFPRKHGTPTSTSR